MDPSALSKLYVTDPNPHDVLLGRGSHLVKYEGNIEFRRLIHDRKDEYIASVRHSQKDHIARDVISKVKSRNGRFLRKVDNPMELKKFRIPSNIASAWVHVEEGIVVEKIKQAFRDSCKEGSLSDLNQSCQEGKELSKVPKPSGNSKALKTDTMSSSNSGGAAQATPHSPVAETEQSQRNKELSCEEPMEADEATSLDTSGTPRHDVQHQPDDRRIIHLLLQHQQNQLQEQQRALLEQLTVLGAANNSTTHAMDLGSMRTDRAAYNSLVAPRGRVDESNQLNAVNNMLVQQLQATALQRSLNAQLAQRRMASAAEPPLRQQQLGNLIPTQLGIRPGDFEFLRNNQIPMSNIELDQAEILRSLQEQRLIGQLSSINDLPLSHQHLLLGAPNSRVSDLAALSSQNRATQALLLANERRSAYNSAGLDFLNQELLLRSAGVSNSFQQHGGGTTHITSSTQRSTNATNESSAFAARESDNPKSPEDPEDRDKPVTSSQRPKKRKL